MEWDDLYNINEKFHKKQWISVTDLSLWSRVKTTSVFFVREQLRSEQDAVQSRSIL